MPRKAFVSLTALPEDDRIDAMGQIAAEGETVGFFVDDNAKADRYLEKLLNRYAVRLIGRSAGPGGTILCRIGPRLN